MSMFSTGILVLTSPLHVLPLRIAPVLTSAAQVVERTLYVHLHPGLNLGTGGQARPVYIPPVVDLCTLISRLYSNAADICGHLDVRVLLSNIRSQPATLSGSSGPFPTPQKLSHSPEVVLTDFPIQDSGQSSLVTQCLQKYAGHCYVCNPSLSSVLLHPGLKEVEEDDDGGGRDVQLKPLETFSDVVLQPDLPLDPYVIGLTGGSGSGKSSIAHRLEGLGAVRIDCDQLGHEAYLPGTSAYHKVIQEFGSDILNEDKTINRRVLGGKVFGNQERLKALTDIVWPEIASLVKKRIKQAKEQGKHVCVVDAAVLLEAGWTYLVHEVWVATIPEEEDEDALRRLKSQWPNAKLIEHANVVLCTLWEPDVTQRQVSKAWNLLQQRIQKRQEITRSSL
ncbi:Bifunctional coenzyme A synthase [Labeo rohita]|uniref:Bifunctional coenzyme A synthase n=1 Tax=Labeo rohita TaxID=84645 RepID=A0ABQ8LER9_LABRO|nr:Bifunctional coenzyme A synthase [Labeo rohita]